MVHRPVKDILFSPSPEVFLYAWYFCSIVVTENTESVSKTYPLDMVLVSDGSGVGPSGGVGPSVVGRKQPSYLCC